MRASLIRSAAFSCGARRSALQVWEIVGSIARSTCAKMPPATRSVLIQAGDQVRANRRRCALANMAEKGPSARDARDDIG